MQQSIGKRAATPCITPTIKHRGSSVIVLGPFANCKVGDLHQVMGKLNQTGYHSILQHNTIIPGTWLVSQGFLLMQDNDPKHACKLSKRYIKSKEEQYILQLMSCRVQSADLNPIGLVSDQLEWKVRAQQPTSSAHLWQPLQESRAELTIFNLPQVFGGKNAENL